MRSQNRHSWFTALLSLLALLCLGFILMLPKPEISLAQVNPSNTPYFTPALQATLVPLTYAQSGGGFGYAVSSSNNIWSSVAVGAPYTLANRGAAYVYSNQNFTSWVQVAQLSAPDGDPGDRFGAAIAQYGDVIVVGAPGDDSPWADVGAAYVYRYENDQWVYKMRLNPPDPVPGSEFGFSVAVSQLGIFVGSPGKDIAFLYNDIGAVYLYDFDGLLLEKFDYTTIYLTSNTYHAAGYRFGYAMDAYGDQVAISAVPANGIGANVHVLSHVDVPDMDERNWYYYAPVVAPANNIGFGQSVGLFHDTLVIGAPLYDSFGTDNGRIFVYRWNGTQFAEQSGSDYALFGNGHQGGYAVDVDRINPIVGAPYATVAPDSTLKGSAMIYRPNARVLLREPSISDNARYGFSVSQYGVDLAIGAPNADHDGLNDAGAVYVYRVVEPPWGTATATPPNFWPTVEQQRVSTITITPTYTLGPTFTFTPSRTPTPLPTATNTPPTPTSPPNATAGANFFTIKTPMLTWNRLSWALGYQIEIDDDPNFGSPIPVPTEFSANTFSYTTPELANGTYYWRVRGRVDTATWGSWSAGQSFVVSVSQ